LRVVFVYVKKCQMTLNLINKNDLQTKTTTKIRRQEKCGDISHSLTKPRKKTRQKVSKKEEYYILDQCHNKFLRHILKDAKRNSARKHLCANLRRTGLAATGKWKYNGDIEF
jgi:hypothetical protein